MATGAAVRPRKLEDEVDVWGQDWARQRRLMLGIIDNLDEKITAKERIGAVRCSIANLKEEREGTGSKTIRFAENGHIDRDWPEVYEGISVLVHRAYQNFPAQTREVMELHYVWRGVPARAKAERMKVSLAQFWILVGHMKAMLYGAVVVNRVNESKEESEVA